MVIRRKMNFFERESRPNKWELLGVRHFFFSSIKETGEPLVGGELLVTLEVTSWIP